MLEKLEKAYAVRRKNGERANAWALWDAVLHRARWKEPLPKWVCEALEIANLKNLQGNLTSFNSVFGKPKTKAQAAKQKRDYQKALVVADLATEAARSGEGRSEEWFEKVGRHVGEGKTRVKDLLWIARNIFLRRAG
jgi:hypothetical protein